MAAYDRTMTRAARRWTAALAVTAATLGAGALAQAASAPTATTGAATSLTPTGATLGATVNPGGQSTTVAFDYGTSSAYGSSTATQNVGSGTDAKDVTAKLSGLQPATTYHFRVSAANASGTKAGSDATFTTPSAPTVKTGTVSAVSTGQATVSATVTPHGQATTIVFDYGTSTAYGSTTAAQNAGSGTSAVTIKATITGLKPGTRYHVRPRAKNATGSANGADVSFTTTTAAGPLATTSAATNVGATTATLPGSVTPRGVATQAYAQYGTSTKYGASTARVSAGSGTKAVTVRPVATRLKPSTRYHYRIVAVNSAGTTTRGADRTFTTAKATATTVLVASPNPVPYGRGTEVRGQVTGGGAASARVTLTVQPFPFTASSTLQSRIADRNGRFTVPLASLRMTTRVSAGVVAGGTTLRTRILRIGVRPSVRTTIARVGARRVRFSGTIRPGGAATVWLRKVGEHSTITVRRVRARGRFSITILRPRTRGIYRIRVRTDTRTLQRFDSRPRAVAGR